jgi:hypothetical protein
MPFGAVSGLVLVLVEEARATISPLFSILIKLAPPTCKSISFDAALLAVSVTFSLIAVGAPVVLNQVVDKSSKLVACVPVRLWPVRVWARNVGASVWPRPMADLIAALSAAPSMVSTFPDTIKSGIF